MILATKKNIHNPRIQHIAIFLNIMYAACIPAQVVQASSGFISPNQKLKVKMGYLQVPTQVSDSNWTGYIAN